MVFIWVHTAATIPHITKITQQFTGTSGYGVGLDASSSKNTTYNQSQTISQEHTMVLLWLQTAITIPINQANNITGTYDGVYLSASSDNNATYKPKPYNITGTYGVYLYADSKLQQTNKKRKKHTKILQIKPITKNNKKMRYNRKQHSIKHSYLIIINTNYKKSNN